MTFKLSLKTISSVRAVKLTSAIGAALLATSCATGPSSSEEFTDQNWQSVANSELQVVAGSQAIAPTGTLSSNKQRKLALRQLAANSILNDAPDAYTVVKGDTLWDISGRFLSRPWLWPEIWDVNPQIENPHLIYPGDRIALTYVEGTPRLQLIRASSKPARQSTPIGTIPGDLIEPFLIKPLVVSQSEMARAAYVAAAEEGRLISSASDHVYVRGDIAGSRYSIYRPGKALVDPDTQRTLGYEALHVSNASLVSAGDPSKMIITDSTRETLVGDRLMAAGEATPAYFTPRAATTTRPGKIISLVGAVARVATNQIVVLNLGENDGVQAGDTFSVQGDDRVVRDTVNQAKSEYFTIEGDNNGVVMVFRSFENVSYALVMSSKSTVRLYDRVVSTADQL